MRVCARTLRYICYQISDTSKDITQLYLFCHVSQKVTFISITCLFVSLRIFSFLNCVWNALFFFLALILCVTVFRLETFSTQRHIVIHTTPKTVVPVFWFLICSRREFRLSLNVMCSLFLPSFMFFIFIIHFVSLGSGGTVLPVLSFSHLLVARRRLTPDTVLCSMKKIPPSPFKVYIFTLLFCSAIFKYTL